MNLRVESPPAFVPRDIESCFAKEKMCRDYLFRLRWPRGFCCPRCGCIKGWPVRDGLYECGFCKYQVSVTSGTIFHNTRVPLRIWFKAIWWLAGQEKAASAMELKRVLKLGSYKTAWTMMHKLRQAMAQSEAASLSGVVEVHLADLRHIESELAINSSDDLLIAIAAQINGPAITQIRMKRVTDVSPSVIDEFVTGTVMAGSKILTDDSAHFAGLIRQGFLHETQTCDGGKAGTFSYLPAASEAFHLFDRWMTGVKLGNISSNRLDCFLDEFVFRFNATRSGQPYDFFYRFLLNVSHSRPMVTGNRRAGRENSDMNEPSTGGRC